MSALPDSEIRVHIVGAGGLSPVQFASVAASLSGLGLAAIWPAMASLWTLWTIDPMKSIGMLVPLVSLVLVLRAWRAVGWQAEGTWWGLVLLLVAVTAERLQQRAIAIMVISPHWVTPLPPPSLVLLVYGSGVVLLLGGVRLYRAALFPILLLWFANPVPHAFDLWVDMPLQQASAYIARAFARDLGHSLTPDNLRLIFSPGFGMFIAPGCNGIRGSVTMGFIALIAGYVYRFRWYANALVVMGAILLGYVFNLARLCLLVVYYVVAMHLPSLKNKAENADYAIGAALFLLATLLLFEVIHRLRDRRNPNRLGAALIPTVIPRPAGLHGRTQPVAYARLAALAAVALVGCAGLIQANAATRPSDLTAGDAAFPATLGNYTLAHSWNETMPVTGQVVYVWGQYAPADGGAPVAIGISPVLGWHDPLLCHSIRGDSPLWQGQLAIASAGVEPISFSSAFYQDGVTQHIEAFTQCTGASCGEFATARTHFGFVYSHIDSQSLLNRTPPRQVPVLLRAETLDTTISADAARQQLTQNLRAFLASVRLDDLTRPYGR
jgi:exosortase J